MPNQSISEPTVSVHGVPQSQYNPAVVGGPSPGSPVQGIGARFNQHPIIWSIGIGVAILIVYVIYKNNQSANATGISSTTGTGTPSSPDQMWGSQLEADNQQIMSFQNNTNGLLQQILTVLQNPSSSPPQGTGSGSGSGSGTGSTGNGGGSSGTGTPPPTGGPLIPFGSLPSTFKYIFGQDLWVGGQEYETGPGSGGVLWGVPITGGKNLSLSQWNSVPIGSGQGQKVELYAPKSAYH